MTFRMFHFVSLPSWQVVEGIRLSNSVAGVACQIGKAEKRWSPGSKRNALLYNKGGLGGVRFGEMSNDKDLCAIHILTILLWITFVDKSEHNHDTMTRRGRGATER